MLSMAREDYSGHAKGSSSAAIQSPVYSAEIIVHRLGTITLFRNGVSPLEYRASFPPSGNSIRGETDSGGICPQFRETSYYSRDEIILGRT